MDRTGTYPLSGGPRRARPARIKSRDRAGKGLSAGPPRLPERPVPSDTFAGFRYVPEFKFSLYEAEGTALNVLSGSGNLRILIDAGPALDRWCCRELYSPSSRFSKTVALPWLWRPGLSREIRGPGESGDNPPRYEAIRKRGDGEYNLEIGRMTYDEKLLTTTHASVFRRLNLALPEWGGSK